MVDYPCGRLAKQKKRGLRSIMRKKAPKSAKGPFKYKLREIL